MRASGTTILRTALFALAAGLIEDAPCRAEERPAAEDVEFFEKRVRPLLAENCWKCHGPTEQKGSLRLDSREGALEGGDTGPALVPGKPEDSELIRAVSYDPAGYQMPPTGKLEQESIDTLTEWVRRGAPWPLERPEARTGASAAFDIEARARHWSFQPVRRPDVPDIENAAWPAAPIDAFILARLENAGLSPAPAAGKRTWLRRVTFDLIGLPPSLKDSAEFLADDSPDAEHKVVDRLLASPHYGERWGRHWLDLVRFAETAGHEFDYDIPYAWRYRDYVVRALNADLPYDRFVVEHIAGDLLDEPRRHPSEGWNESILGTGFWWLGQGKHSPVDIRAEECDRFDNQIDVLGKAFLGLTIACARCHDHKFDPVSAADYYALAGYLQSTQRQLAFIDDERLEAVQRRLTKLKRAHRRDAAAVAGRALLHAIDGPAGELLVAEAAGVGALAKHTDRGAFRRAKAEQLQRVRAAVSMMVLAGEETFDDFSGERYTKWFATGAAFGSGPSAAGDFVIGSGPEEPVREILPAEQAHSGRLSRRFRGVLRSETFTIEKPYIDYRVRRIGGRSSPGRKHKNGQIHLIVDGFHLIQEPLYGGLSINTSNDGEFHWYRQDVSKLLGSRASIEIEDEEPDGCIVVDRVLFTTGPRPAEPPNGLAVELLTDPAIDSREALLDRCARLARKSVSLWRESRLPAAEHADERIALLNAILHTAATHIPPSNEDAREQIAAWLDEYRTVESACAPSRRALAAVDGSSENEDLLVRGNHRKPGPEVPRRFLEVFLQPDVQSPPLNPQPSAATGSGRLDLARRIADPHNSLLPRVLVNRLWHHHFGRGLAPTVDNLGVLGESPSHPELLEWLAAEFVGRVNSHESTVESQMGESTDHGPRTTDASRPQPSTVNPQPSAWSLKRLHRAMVLSRTYRMSSAASDPRTEAADPENLFWHRMPVRRLEAEIIRDGMLAVSGRLDRRMEGESVLPYLTPFMEGRGRPPESGPLDGAGRRSLYLSVRRNFLTPMFLAFDYPTPLSTMGRRSVSNVPAQALALMNNPLVIEQAGLWAHRTLREAGGDAPAAEIISRLYLTAFTRPPSEDELAAALAFVAERAGTPPGSPSVEAWAELCHVLLNVKEFVFVY